MEILSHESLFSIKEKLSEIEVGIMNQTKHMLSVDTLKEVMFIFRRINILILLLMIQMPALVNMLVIYC